MRKMNPPPSAKSILRLSAEEQAILQDEQNQALQEVQNGGDEIDRLVDTSAGLDDTVLIVSETPEFGEVDRGLVDLVADTAVAGTDADPEQIVATTDTGLAAEGFVSDALERLKKLWDKIKEYLANAWKSLTNYLSSEKRQLENVHKQAIEVEKFIEENHSILMLEWTPENVKKVSTIRLSYSPPQIDEHGKPLRLQHQRSDDVIPMSGPGQTRLGYDASITEREDKAQADANTRREAEEARRNKPMQLQNQRNDHAMPMPGPNHIKLGYDQGVDERKAQAQGESDAAYQKRVAEEATARGESDSRNEGARRAAQEKALNDVKNKLATHQFQFHGDLSLISTMSGVPKDFEKQVINLSSYAQDLHRTIGKTLRNMCHEFEGIIGKFEGGKGQHEVPALVERFHKDFEIIGRSIGEVKNHDGMLRAHSKGPLLGHFDVELVDHKKDGESNPVRMLIDVSKAVMEVTHGHEKRQGEVPLLQELMSPALASTIKRWTEFQLGNDAASLENDLKHYGEKFTAKIDHLMQAQQHVKVLEDEHNTYQLINGLISVCRMLDKMIIEFTLKYATAVRLIMQNVLRYQQQAAEERVRLFKEAMAAL